MVRWNDTAVSRLLNIKYPIIQGPFGGRFSSVKLASSVSNQGGMGSFGLHTHAPEEIIEINRQLAQATDKTYALNLWVPLENDPVADFDQREFEKWKDIFKPHFDKMKLPLPEFPSSNQQIFELQMESVLRAKPPAASFIFGIPPSEILTELKKRGIKSIATATTLEEALVIEEADVDIIVASGSEAGGHRASFIKPAEDSLTGTRLLIHQVADNVKKPVVAAGGISNGQDIFEILKLGASAVQLGTVFLATNQSNAPDFHKKELLSAKPLKTSLTKVYTGRLARAISNSFSEEFNAPDNKTIAPFPLQSTLISTLRKSSLDNKKLDYVALWAGEPSEVLKHRDSVILFNALIEKVDSYTRKKAGNR